MSVKPRPSATCASLRAPGRSCNRIYVGLQLSSAVILLHQQASKHHRGISLMYQAKAGDRAKGGKAILLVLEVVTIAPPRHGPKQNCMFTCLFVSIDKQQGILQLFLLENCMKLFPRCSNSFSVTTVNHIYYSLCVWVVTSPIWPYTCLPTKVPNLKLDVLVRNRLYVEPYCCSAQNANASLDATLQTISRLAPGN